MGEFNPAKEFDVQKVRGVVRGVVSAAVFGMMISLCMEDAKFSYTVPANLLPLILAFFSFLFFFSLVPLFLLFLFRVQMNALP